MNLDQAQQIISIAQSKAESMNLTVSIAVLDTYAYLIAFIKMDNCILGSIDLAIGKARTAALFQVSSNSLKLAIHPDGPAPSMQFSNGGLITFAGGQPVIDAHGILVGAVGVSGGTVDQDNEIATIASKTLNK